MELEGRAHQLFSRGLLFFCVNLMAGMAAARAALITEMLLRAVTSGIYGALTGRFRRVEPAWAGTLTAMMLLPLTSHSLELVVHWLRQTPALAPSIVASVLFTACSTAFNLEMMRHGVLTVGAGSQSLRDDLRALPRVLRHRAGITRPDDGSGSGVVSQSP